MTGRPPFRPLRRRTVTPKGSGASAELQPTSAAPGARGKLCDRREPAQAVVVKKNRNERKTPCARPCRVIPVSCAPRLKPTQSPLAPAACAASHVRHSAGVRRKVASRFGHRSVVGPSGTRGECHLARWRRLRRRCRGASPSPASPRTATCHPRRVPSGGAAPHPAPLSIACNAGWVHGTRSSCRPGGARTAKTSRRRPRRTSCEIRAAHRPSGTRRACHVADPPGAPHAAAAARPCAQ